jgi:hypothetical protein
MQDVQDSRHARKNQGSRREGERPTSSGRGRGQSWQTPVARHLSLFFNPFAPSIHPNFVEAVRITERCAECNGSFDHANGALFPLPPSPFPLTAVARRTVAFAMLFCLFAILKGPFRFVDWMPLRELHLIFT